jgi:hypothetical protein
MADYVQDNSLDIRLPQTPQTADPKLYNELALIYNAIRQLQYGVDQFLDIPPKVQTAPYTIDISDRGKSVDTNSAVTIPNSSTQAFPPGATVLITNISNIPINVIPTAGVTLIKAGTNISGAVALGPYGMATIRYLGTNVWLVVGAGI